MQLVTCHDLGSVVDRHLRRVSRDQNMRYHRWPRGYRTPTVSYERRLAPCRQKREADLTLSGLEMAQTQNRHDDGLGIRERRIKEGWRVELVDPTKQDGTSLSWCAVIGLNVRIGSTCVRTGGIAGVGTHKQYRRLGYSRRVMNAAIALMQRQQLGVSLLHGIQDYYHRFDYITCMAEHRFALETASLRLPAAECGRMRLRRLTKNDLPVIARLFNRQNTERTGSIVRVAKKFDGFHKGTWWTIPADVRVVVDSKQKISGYVVCDRIDDHCRVSEVGGQGREVWSAIVNYLGRRAKRGGHAQIEVLCAPDEPFGIFCRSFGVHLLSQFPRNERTMGRVIDLRKCMISILPELERRWGSHDRKQAIFLKTDIGDLILRWRAGHLAVDDGKRGRKASGSGQESVVSMNQSALTLLLFGYARPSDVILSGQARIPATQRQLMERLFPLQDAYMSWTDRF